MENFDMDWRINKALNSLDGIQRAKANPFLYTRVKAALEEQNSPWLKAARLFGRPAYALTLCFCFITINLWVAIGRQQQQPAKIVAEQEQAFATEFATVNYNLMELNSNDR